MVVSLTTVKSRTCALQEKNMVEPFFFYCSYTHQRHHGPTHYIKKFYGQSFGFFRYCTGVSALFVVVVVVVVDLFVCLLVYLLLLW